MGLDFAIDELYATGWTALDSAGCEPHADGRFYPNLDRVKQYFAEHGCTLTIKHIQLFDCHQAEWRDAAGHVQGAVVGQSPAEAAVYAMSKLRRQIVSQGVA